MPSARADLVSNQVDLAWLARYPLPSKVIVDSGHKLAKFKTMIQAAYGIKEESMTLRKP